jgi:hypothetical protein
MLEFESVTRCHRRRRRLAYPGNVSLFLLHLLCPVSYSSPCTLHPLQLV